MANRHDIAHRFANKLEGKNGRISAGNVRYEGRNYYSYNTVFGQWVDVEKNVVVVFEGSTSNSSSKHKLGKWCFPDDVHVFPYNDNRGSWCSYDGCDLMGWESKFTFKHRCILIDYYVTKIYNSLAAIKDGKKKGLENVDFTAWGYIEELCSLYKDTTINKYIKWTNNNDYKKLVLMMKAGERNVEVLTDVLFGEGTFKKYWDYCARYRKQSDKREKMEKLCKRLGIASPYESSYCGGWLYSGLTADQIRKLTAKERNDLHFASIMRDEQRKEESAVNEKYNKNMRNAYKWIVGYEPVKKSQWCSSYNESCTKVRNMYTGEVYEVPCDTTMPSFMGWRIEFEYDKFRKSDDKEQWIRNFYTKCRVYSMRKKAHDILKRIGCPTRAKVRSWDDNQYYDCEVLRQNTTTEEYSLCLAYIRVFDEHKNREDAEERARKIERMRREEEERKEKEYQAKVKQEQIDECLERGVEGCRDLWRKHMLDIHTASYRSNEKDNVYYYGGNVLLRLNLNKDKVETSKNIRIPVEVCKKMWKIVSKWHENPSCFKEMQIDTKGSGRYTISSYENDILTAGCHKIAYTEMERMYNEIIAAV